MALATILAEVRTILLAVDGMSPLVYTRERWAAQASIVRSIYVTAGRLHAWTITRQASAETRLATGHENERRHTLILRGYYSWDDAADSEITFQVLIEEICLVFRALPNLNGTVETSEPIQVELIEPRMFCEVLCHYAELRLETLEFIHW
jgi:hypothetical protein